MPVLSLSWKLPLIYYRLHVDVYLAVVSVPLLTFFSKEDQNIFRSSTLWPYSGHLKTANYISKMAPKKQVHFGVPEYMKTWHGSTGFLCPAIPSPTIAKNRGLAKSSRTQDCSSEKPEGKPALHTLNQKYDRSPWGQNQLVSSWKDAAGDPPGRSTGHGAASVPVLVAHTTELGSSAWACVHPRCRSTLKTDISRGKRVSPWGLHFQVEIVRGKVFP